MPIRSTMAGNHAKAVALAADRQSLDYFPERYAADQAKPKAKAKPKDKAKAKAVRRG